MVQTEKDMEGGREWKVEREDDMQSSHLLNST